MLFLLIPLTGCALIIDEELDKVVKGGDWEKCSTLGEEGDSRVMKCISRIAIDKKDSYLCGKISDIYYKDDCYSEMVVKTNRIDLCDKVSAARRSSCFTEFAFQLKDPNLCKKISDELQSEREDCLVRVAETGGGSYDQCFDIKNPVKKDQCVMNMARGMGEAGVCVQLESESKEIQCVINVVRATGNKGECNLIENSPLDKGTCLKEAAYVKLDENICDEIVIDSKDSVRAVEIGRIRDDCLVFIGIDTNRATVCNGINDVTKKNRCYATIASSKGEWEVCERIDDGLDKDRCIYQAAMTSGDSSDCQNIDDSEIKADCLADFEMY